MATIPGIICKWLVKDITFCLLPGVALAGVGYYLDKNDNLVMTRYRDRSSLYGKVRVEGEPYTPSWP